jgi:hypothetical protein
MSDIIVNVSSPEEIIISEITENNYDIEIQNVPDINVEVGLCHSIPEGGDEGQLLAKASDTNYDAEWVDPPEDVEWGNITGALANQADLQTILDGKQNTLGYTPENVANLRTSFHVTPDDTHYISEKLAKDSLDGKSSISHNHNLNDLAEKSYNSLTDKPIDGAVSTSYAPANPTALAGTGTFMFGLGSTLVITPLKTGRVMFFINFIPTGAGTPYAMSTYQLAYGTGVAPVNGAAATGTNFDSADSGSNYTASVSAPQYTHTHCFIISGLVVGTAYWFDVKGTKATGATNIGMTKIRCSIIEEPY